MKLSSQLGIAKTIERKVKEDHQRDVLRMLNNVYPGNYRMKVKGGSRKGLQNEEEFATLRRLIFQVSREEPGTDSYEAHFASLKFYVKHLFDKRKNIYMERPKEVQRENNK